MAPSFLILAIAAILVIGLLATPIVLVFQFFRINSTSGRLIYLSAVAVAAGAVLFPLYSYGFIGSSRARLQRDHTLSLPPSVTSIHCQGPVSLTTFGDFGAVATFEMNRSELNSVFSQFTFTPSLDRDQMSIWSRHPFAPVTFGALEMARWGHSHDGNVVRLQVYGLTKSRVGVLVDTVWN
jgi:hypothetical protein